MNKTNLVDCKKKGFCHNARKRQSPSSLSDLAKVPSKARKMLRIQKKVTDLTEDILHTVFQFCSLADLENLSITSKQFSLASISFLMSSKSVAITFPFLTRAPLQTQPEEMDLQANQQLLCVLGTFYVANISKARKDISLLAIVFKKMTCMMDTKARLTLAFDFLSRLEVDLISDMCFVQTRQLLAWNGIFFHQLIHGWVEEECQLAVKLLISHMKKKHRLDEIMDESYDLGSCPGVEIFYKHFFFFIFQKDVPGDQQVKWISFFLQFITDGDPKVTAKLFLLMTSSSKEDLGHWQFGIQWSDHIEAIPANLSVATSRYSKLVKLILAVQKTSHAQMLPEVLHSLFTTPSPWLPENIGSVLLLLGPSIASLYIGYLCAGCINCLNKSITASLVGVSIMTLRFNWSFQDLAFARMEEAIHLVPDELREGMVTAVWRGFSDEVADLRLAAQQSEDWAVEGGKYLYAAIQKMGELMMMKALYNKPRMNVEP